MGLMVEFPLLISLSSYLETGHPHSRLHFISSLHERS
jgi:hypothetical protein